MDLLLPLAGLGDVVGGLHPHERVHLHSKGFLNTERHIPGKLSLAVTDRPAGSIISFQMKSPGWDGFFIGIAFTPYCTSGSLPNLSRRFRALRRRYGTSNGGCA
jgi:hypothetical protein